MQSKADHQCHLITIAGFAGVPFSGVEPILAGVRDQLIAYIHDKQLSVSRDNRQV